MFYSVKYKLPGQWFYRKLSKLKGDGIIPESQSRWFILEDDSRVEVPNTAVFVFPRERFLCIKLGMEKESGQQIQV